MDLFIPLFEHLPEVVRWWLALPGGFQAFLDTSGFILVWFAVFLGLEYKEHSI